MKFTKDLKWLLKQLGLGTGYSIHSFRRRGAGVMLQNGIPGEIIKLMGDWTSDYYERNLDVSIPFMYIRNQRIDLLVKLQFSDSCFSTYVEPIL